MSPTVEPLTVDNVLWTNVILTAERGHRGMRWVRVSWGRSKTFIFTGKITGKITLPPSRAQWSDLLSYGFERSTERTLRIYFTLQ